MTRALGQKPVSAQDDTPTKPLTVAFLADAIHPYHQGGKETRLHQISSRMAREGHDVHIYTMNWWQGKTIRGADGVTLHALCPKVALYSGDKRSTLQAIMFGLATFRLLTHRFDVLDVDQMPFFPLFSARVVCALRRKTLVATWHEVWGAAYWRRYLGPLGLAAALVERLAVYAPHLIVSNSLQTTDRLKALRTRAEVRTVPLGVDRSAIDSILPASGPSEQSDIIFAGRLLSHKNVDHLIDAVALLAPTRPGLRCIIVGEGPERTKLEAQVQTLRLGTIVTFRNFRPEHADLMSLMKSSKVFVLPSEREGFGLVVPEANACGLPVVTVQHDDNAARHLITSGVNGTVTNLNPAALASAIGDLLDRWPFSLDLNMADDWDVVAARVASILTSARDDATPSARARPWARGARRVRARAA